jgi:hypothetical protein
VSSGSNGPIAADTGVMVAALSTSVTIVHL